MGGISPFSGFVVIDFSVLTVIVLTMLAASIDGFLLFWQPAIRANFSIVSLFFLFDTVII